MKQYYLRLTIFLILVSNITFAQYDKIKQDSEPEILNADEIMYRSPIDESSWTFECECSFTNSYIALWNLYAQVAQAERDSWLRHQENNLLEEIEQRLGEDFSNFRDAQHAFFKEFDGIPKQETEIGVFRNSMMSQKNQLETSLDSEGAEYRVLYLRFKDIERVNYGGTAYYDFGALEYEGTRIMDMNYHQANNAAGENGYDYGILVSQLDNIITKYNRSVLIHSQDGLANFIADQWINSYGNIGNYEDRIKVMSYYMVKNWGGFSMTDPTPPNIPGYPYGSYMPIIDYQSKIDNLTNNNNLPSSIYDDEVSDIAEFKTNYALKQMNDNEVFDFVSSNSALKNVVQEHFEKSDYNTPSINAIKTLMQSYTNGATSLGNFFNYYKSFSGQDSDRPEYLAKMRRYPAIEGSGYYDFPDVLEQFSYDATDLASKGNLIREFMAKGGKTLPASLTNEMLGKLFDITGNTDYFNLEYSSYAKAHITDWDYGPYGWAWLNDEFFIEGLKAVAEGGEMNWGDKILKSSNFIGTKADCVLTQLINTNNNLLKRVSESFTQNDSKYKIRFTTYNDPTVTYEANTPLPDSNGIIEIQINTAVTQGSTAIDFASIIFHEVIHAELHRIKLSNNSSPNPMTPDQYNWYVKMWEFYEDINSDPNYIATNAEHNFMAFYFINPISEGLREFDNNAQPVSKYQYFAWTGLQFYGKQSGYITQAQLNDLADLTLDVVNDDNSNPCDD